MQRIRHTVEGRLALRALLLAVLSLAGAEIGHWLSFPGTPIATFWPPSGIFLAALLVSKRQDWWALVAAQLGANLVSYAVFHQQAIGVSLGFGLANVCGALTAASLLSWRNPGGFAFFKLRQVFDYLLCGAIAGPAVGALLGAAVIRIAFPAENLLTSAAIWWTSASLGVILVGSLGITLLTDDLPLRGSDTIPFGLLMVLIAVGITWAGQPADRWSVIALAYPLLYLQLPAFTAIMFNRKSSLVIMLIIALVSIFRTTRELGIIPQLCAETLDRAICLQLFMGITSFAGLLVGTIVHERRVAEDSLRLANQDLESRVTQRTRQLEQTTADLFEKQELLAHACRVSTAGELVAGIAHELNQPLYAIHNYASGLKRCMHLGSTEVDVPAVLEDLQLETERAAEIVKRLRHYVQRTVVKSEDVCLTSVLRDALQLNRHELRQKCIEVQVNIPPDLPRLRGDAIQLQQVLVNLLRNASDSLRLVPEDCRKIRISVSQQEAQLRIVVEDTGAGFKPEDQVRLFDAFFTTKPDGMGMGLAISRSIIEAHGGQLSARRVEPTGAAFEFVLPLPRVESEGAGELSHPVLAPPHFSLVGQALNHESQATHLSRG